MNWLKKFGSLCLAVVLSVCLVAQVGSALADDKKVTSVEVETMPTRRCTSSAKSFLPRAAR